MATELAQPDKTAALVFEDRKVSPFWFQWFINLRSIVNFSGLAANQAANLPGLSVTITTAKLTGAGVNGSMTFTNGILTAQTQAT